MSNLENKLSHLHLRKAPGAWKREILGASVPVEKNSWMHLLRYSLVQFYPGHRLMTGLAAAWVMILTLHLLTPTFPAMSGPTISLEQLVRVQAEEREILAEIDRMDHPEEGVRLSLPLEEMKALHEQHRDLLPRPAGT